MRRGRGGGRTGCASDDRRLRARLSRVHSDTQSSQPATTWLWWSRVIFAIIRTNVFQLGEE